MSNLIKRLPVIALRCMTIMPDMIIHFDVSRKRSVQAIEQAMLAEQEIFLLTQKDGDIEEPSEQDLYHIGTVAVIKQVIKLPNNLLRILVEGIEEGELLSLEDDGRCLCAEVSLGIVQDEAEIEELTKKAMLRQMQELFAEYAVIHPKMNKELLKQLSELSSMRQMMTLIINNISLYYEQRQQLLELTELTEKYELLCKFLVEEVEIFKIKKQFQEKVKERVDKNQREYILREQMRLIREELGEDTTGSDAELFLEQLAKLKAGKEVKEKIKKEISRFSNTSSSSSESAVIRGYIETLLELPWNKASKDNNDVKNAEKILNEDHYGLEKVKERILEFLAVRSLTKKGESPIICLVGPPGTGKTSIARSVARALNKEYVRICLGGVRDEAEIRGHRKTYVGAMPGRIANGLRTCGVKNPLMLLDEIDKISSDFKGDTASALLEVLDSEQNNKFRDHYVEIPIDLSEVLFIATANSVQNISRPLLDRMELIEVTSYTENEKLHIAKEHLIAKQIDKNGLQRQQLSISDAALEKVIRSYTKEAGVRTLERKIGQICRKAARELLESGKKTVKVTEKNLERFLGKEKYFYDMANENDEIGIVRGLAWTSVGGDTLQIEVNIMPGKGEFKLTGQLGDVMKESAVAGISYIRSISKEQGIAADFFKKNDIHIHIPEGSVPKDGPSAGITMATAMLSAIIKKKVRSDLAMTGEITLRGRVLPIGGLKEKILAAKNAGIKTVLIPKKNVRDIEEISEEIKKGVEIIPVESMEEVICHAIVK